jgi:hypothetical protein
MKEIVKLSAFKKLMVFEQIGENITNSNGEILRYSALVKLVGNIVLLAMFFAILLYSVKMKSYFPVIYGGLGAYLLVRVPIVCFLSPKFVVKKDISLRAIFIFMMAVFVLIIIKRHMS